MIAGMEPASMVRFTAAARLLGQAARERGLVSPGFRSPPRLLGADRTLRRRRARSTIAVRVLGRLWVPVLADMIEGVVVANQLSGPPADRLREALWDSVAAELAADRAGAVPQTDVA
jgi:hypothetical protein